VVLIEKCVPKAFSCRAGGMLHAHLLVWREQGEVLIGKCVCVCT